MKKLLVFMMVGIMLVCLSALAGAEETWTCPSCKSTATGNFCSTCGEKKPDDGNWTCSVCGMTVSGNFCANCGAKKADSGNQIDKLVSDKVRLDLSIAFEKNAYFSTYDVKLFVDGEWITTMRHGIDYASTVYVTKGKHIITFQEDNSSYPSTGTAIINVDEPILYTCEIHAKMDAIQITDERIEFITDDRPLLGSAGTIVRIDGDLTLQVSVEFRKNGAFSQYDVDMYCDNTYIATLPHGKNFEGTLLVSKGSHAIAFYKSGEKSIRGASSFKVEKDAARFSCKIEAERNKVDISDDKLTY